MPRGEADANKEALQRIVDVGAGMPSVTPISSPHRDLHEFKQYSQARYLARGRRCRDLALPPSWATDGLYGFGDLQDDGLVVAHRFLQREAPLPTNLLPHQQAFGPQASPGAERRSLNFTDEDCITPKKARGRSEVSVVGSPVEEGAARDTPAPGSLGDEASEEEGEDEEQEAPQAGASSAHRQRLRCWTRPASPRRRRLETLASPSCERVPGRF